VLERVREMNEEDEQLERAGDERLDRQQ